VEKLSDGCYKKIQSNSTTIYCNQDGRKIIFLQIQNNLKDAQSIMVASYNNQCLKEQREIYKKKNKILLLLNNNW
jgi:hypothetical protein